KKFLNIINQFRRESHAVRVAHYCEQSLTRPRIIEPLDCRSQSVLRDADADLSRGDLLDRMGFVENDEIIWKKEPALAVLLYIRRAEQYEKQGVIEHDHVGSQQTFSCLLIKTARILAAGFLGADVRLTANLHPNFWIGLDGQIAERSVAGRAGPFGQPLQFVFLQRLRYTRRHFLLLRPELEVLSLG